MLTGVKDIDIIILNKLEDKDLVNICRVNKLADRLCKDQIFWLNRILSKFPSLNMEILNKYKGNRSWSEYYINDLRNINYINSGKYLLDGTKTGRLDHIILSLNNGTNIHFLDDVAIKWASAYGHIDIVKYLVEAGANVHSSGNEALQLANYYRHTDIVNYLKSLP